MNRLAAFIITLLVIGCRPDSKNDLDTLDKIFDSESFDVELQYTSSWGNPKYVYTLTDKNDYYSIELLSTGQIERIERWRIDSLKEFLKPRIGRDLGGLCTNSTYVQIGTFFNSVKYHHSNCGGSEGSALEELLNLKELFFYVEPEPEVYEEGSLNALLLEQKKQFLKNADSLTVASYESSIQAIDQTDVLSNQLIANGKVSDFTLVDQRGDSINLKRMVRYGPLVLMWIRGSWCPYDSITLTFFNKKFREIEDAGGNLVVISPEIPDSVRSMSTRLGLQFPILSDVRNEVAHKLGIVYSSPNELLTNDKENIDLQAYNGTELNELPFTTTLIVDIQRKPHYIAVNADFRKRDDIEDVIGMVANVRSYSDGYNDFRYTTEKEKGN